MKHQNKSCLRKLMQFCPYSVLWGAVKTAVQERRLPSSARPGAMMILLGIFCPFSGRHILEGQAVAIYCYRQDTPVL